VALPEWPHREVADFVAPIGSGVRANPAPQRKFSLQAKAAVKRPNHENPLQRLAIGAPRDKKKVMVRSHLAIAECDPATAVG